MTYPFTKTYNFDAFAYKGGEYCGTYEVNQDGEVESPRVSRVAALDYDDALPENEQAEVADAHRAENEEEMEED